MGARVFFFSFLLFFSISSSAQTADEWLRQRSTQIRYLAKQIAGLEIYIQLLRDGYSIVSDGCTIISDLKTGDFNLHKDYFHSLLKANATLKNTVYYDGPCREEFERLMQEDYYQLTDDERLSRIRNLINHCQP
jgi:hypothetical protein